MFWRSFRNCVIVHRCAMSKFVIHDEPSPSLAAASSDTDCDAVSSSCSHSGASASLPQDVGDCAMRHFAWISQSAPQFAVNGADVRVLSEPSEFYETLKRLARTATRRIVLASLYIGTGKYEQELIDCIRTAVAESKSKDSRPVRVSVLLDYMRGSRGVKNSRTMLLPLLKEFPLSVTVSLFHTPNLRGIVRRLVPERYNETFGVNHIKAYIFDDTVVISGANLSELYFTQRQDRYIVLSACPSLADFFDRLVSCVQRYSFHLQADDTVRLADGVTCHPFGDADGGAQYKREFADAVHQVIAPSLSSDCADRVRSAEKDTVVYPLIQMGPVNVTVDERVTSRLFRDAPSAATLYLASGYFNLTDTYQQSIVDQCAATFSILSAAPEANGFFGGKGLSGAIPDVYTCIARRFWSEVVRSWQHDRISLHEYSKPGWTVHAKGLWYHLPNQQLPIMTMVGSPNFGYRSVYRDLEAQTVIVTTNTALQQQLDNERRQLYARSTAVTRDTFTLPQRRVPFWVKLVTPVIRNFF